MKSKLDLLFEKAMLAAAAPAKFSNISIGTLEKSVKSLAKKLEALGLKCETNTFRTGPGGSEHYGPSYVELSAVGVIPDSDGDEANSDVRFIAGGYGSTLPYHFGGDAWKTMAAKGTAYLIRDLQRQGWKPHV